MCQRKGKSVLSNSASDASTIEGSNAQTAAQENTCSNAVCANAGAQQNIALASGISSLTTESTKSNDQSNSCVGSRVH